MLKVIIVDDEQYICGLIENLIDWKALDMEVVGVAMSGMDALRLIQFEKPDIVISDIRMPGIDGLALVKEVQQLGINTTFILVSGHKEFQYAYSAIKYGVEYYMLKPINKKELLRNLEQIKEKLAHEKQNNIKIVKMIDQSKERFLSDLVNSPKVIKEKDAVTLFEEYQLYPKYQNYSLILLKLDLKVDLNEEQEKIIIGQLNNFITHATGSTDKCIKTYSMRNQILVLLSYSVKEILKWFYEIIKDMQQQYYNYCYITAGIAPPVSSINDLNYSITRKSIIYRIGVGCNRVINAEEHSFSKIKFLPEIVLHDLKNQIKIADKEKITEWFELNKEIFLSSQIDPYDQFTQALDCAKYIIEGLTTLYKSEQNYSFSLDYIHEKIYNAFTRQLVFDCIKNYTIEATENFKKLKASEDTKYVRFAKQYIDEHYHENVSLNDVAQHLYINPAYFSTLFKKQEGENFSDYLAKYRIELAKEMLKNTLLNIGEIGSKVGYSSSKYFSKLFHKVVGISPSNYRKLFS